VSHETVFKNIKRNAKQYVNLNDLAAFASILQTKSFPSASSFEQ
jgi:hypothetical protein